jgi:hypothetical protein
LRYFHERFGNKPSATTSNMATMLKSVARHWLKADEATLLKMRKIGKKLSVVDHGLTPKNRERLRPFHDLGNCRKLLSLPGELRKEIERGKLPAHRRKTLGQVAVALELLLMAPIRSKNLVSLDIERHLRPAGRKLMLTIPADEVKNNVDLDFELPDQSANLIRWYLKHVREAEPGNSALFPSPNGGYKDKDTLAIQLMETVKRYTGFTVNLHLFRHMVMRSCAGCWVTRRWTQPPTSTLALRPLLPPATSMPRSSSCATGASHERRTLWTRQGAGAHLPQTRVLADRGSEFVGGGS